jgi:hypothetical protein
LQAKIIDGHLFKNTDFQRKWAANDAGVSSSRSLYQLWSIVTCVLSRPEYGRAARGNSRVMGVLFRSRNISLEWPPLTKIHN